MWMVTNDGLSNNDSAMKALYKRKFPQNRVPWEQYFSEPWYTVVSWAHCIFIYFWEKQLVLFSKWKGIYKGNSLENSSSTKA